MLFVGFKSDVAKIEVGKRRDGWYVQPEVQKDMYFKGFIEE